MVEARAQTARSTRLVLGTLLCALLSSAPGCSGRVEYRELPLEPVPGTAMGKNPGSMQLTVHRGGPVQLKLRLNGLQADTGYVLCLNPAAADSPTSRHLGTLSIPGWPLGEFWVNPSGQREGFWDFLRIQTDSEGRFDDTLTIPLPPMEYKVRLLIKHPQPQGVRSILQSNAIFMAIEPSLFGT